MSYLIIPNGVSSTSATLWLGGINESLDQAQVIIEPGGAYQPFKSVRQQWRARNGMYALDYRRDLLIDLQPRKTYWVELRVNGRVRADAEFTTLPAQLPTVGDKPLTVLLGSCFCAPKDASGKVGNTYFSLPAGEQPDIKIWSGDQVYLDDPWYHYTAHTHSAADLEVRHFENYLRAWSQSGTAQGFNHALKKGANYFSSDDHEFWNNAPNWTTLIRDSWSEEGRANWWTTSRALFEAFQTEKPITGFTVSPLSFFIADTRINRDGERREFMKPEDLAVLGDWVKNLKGPGVLTLGQPIFSTKAGFFGQLSRKFSDWKLPDYEQFRELAKILTEAQHSIVILTGDVHYGRVARCVLRSGLELIEIISSPTALVDDKVGKKWGEPPTFYPSFDIPGIARGAIETVGNFRLVDDHFLTIQFSAIGTQVRMVVKAWPITGPGVTSRSSLVYERLLQ